MFKKILALCLSVHAGVCFLGTLCNCRRLFRRTQYRRYRPGGHHIVYPLTALIQAVGTGIGMGGAIPPAGARGGGGPDR